MIPALQSPAHGCRLRHLSTLIALQPYTYSKGDFLFLFYHTYVLSHRKFRENLGQNQTLFFLSFFTSKYPPEYCIIVSARICCLVPLRTVHGKFHGIKIIFKLCQYFLISSCHNLRRILECPASKSSEYQHLCSILLCYGKKTLCTFFMDCK